jgi:pimeloyl-ACP methyl ester carboxylesterase
MAERALLLGWGNSTPTQLATYARLYAALGLAARTVIPDTRAGLGDPRAFSRALEPVANDLVKSDTDRGLVVHLFSDNGFIGWAALLDALERLDQGDRVKAAIRGVVYDSSPGLWNVRGKIDFARRFALGMTPALSRALRLGPRERLPVLTPLLGVAFVGYQLLFPRAVGRMMSAAERVRRLQPRCPHLFMYGEQDALVPPHDVRAWITEERAAGIDVEEIAFTTARHVALFPNDPRRYRDELRRFLDRIR